MGLPHPLQGLRELRRARRLPVAEIAKIIDVKPTSYLRFETGTRRIYLDKALTLANRLGVKLDDLTMLVDEQDALRICDQRDKEAIAAGTFNRALWTPGAPASAQSVPPPPPEPAAEPEQIAAVPPPPPPVPAADATVEDQVKDLMEGWDGAS